MTRALLSLAFFLATACPAGAQDWAKDSGSLRVSMEAKRYDEALQTCTRLLAIYRDESQVSHLHLQRVNALMALKRLDEAREDCRAALQLPLSLCAKNELAWHSAGILAQQQKFAEAGREFQHVVADYGFAVDGLCQDAGRKVVDCYVAQKDYDAALKAAHVVYDAGETNWAVPKIAECLKLLDGNAGRAKAFVLFQMYGPPSAQGEAAPEDVPKDAPKDPRELARNVLAEIGYPAWDAEVVKSFERSVGEIANNWQDLRRKGRVCLYAGKPEEAARYFFRAFRECPDSEVARSGEELVLGPVRAVQGTEVALDVYYQFLRTGTSKEKLDPRLQAIFVGELDQAAPPQVAGVLAGLERCIIEPLIVRRDLGQQMRNRLAMLDTYCRIASAKGRGEDVLRLCREILADLRLSEVQTGAVAPAAATLRKRDGHMAGERSFLEDLTAPLKAPAATPYARQMARNKLNELEKVKTWDKPFNRAVYRSSLPREEKKK